MPYVPFGSPTNGTTIETELTDVKLRRAFRYIRTQGNLSTSLIRAGRSRSTGPLKVVFEGKMDVNLKRKVRFSPLSGRAEIRTITQYFLNATPAVPPVGNLRLPNVNQFLNKNYVPPGFNGTQHHTRGDQIVIQFVVRGQKMNGLKPMFHACRTDQPIGSPHDLIKEGAEISITDPVRDTSTGVETMSGSFYINPGDTKDLPDGTLEFVYEFKLADGLGRVFTLERGKFRISSHC